MATQEWSFVGPKAHRSTHVVPDAWELHKAELIELYGKQSLERVMLHMKESYGFSPSKRQYIYQFDKWGLSKYNKSTKEMNDTKNSIAPTPSSEANPRIPTSEKQASTILDSGLTATKRKCKESRRPRKRPKIELVIINPSSKDAPEFKEPSSSIEGETLTEVSSNTFVAGEKEIYHKVYQNQLAVLATAQHLGSEPLLQLDGHPDLGQILRDLSSVEVARILVVADFLAASQCSSEAFHLYFILLERHSDIPRRIVECALIGGTRNAALSWQIEAMENLLKHYLITLQSEQLTQINLRKVIYIQLIEEIQEKNKIVHRMTRLSNITAETSWPIDSLVSASRDAKPLVLERAYQSNKNARPVFHIAQETPWDHAVEVAAISNAIRDFLDWCRSILNSHEASVRLLSNWPFADHRTEGYMSVYHSLVQSFLAGARNVLQPCSSQWPNLSETELGLSPARFLANVALMLFSRVGTTCYVSNVTGRYKVSSLDGLIIPVCNRLSAASDDSLAFEFLTQHYLISSGTIGTSDHIVLTSENKNIRPLVKDQVETLWRVRLPRHDSVKHLWDTGQLLGFCPRQYNPKIFAPDLGTLCVPSHVLSNCTSTLAESLHSSEYRSFKATGCRSHKASRQDHEYQGVPPSWNIENRGYYAKISSESWSSSRHVSSQRSAVSAAEIEKMITDCSSVDLNNERQVCVPRKRRGPEIHWPQDALPRTASNYDGSRWR